MGSIDLPLIQVYPKKNVKTICGNQSTYDPTMNNEQLNFCDLNDDVLVHIFQYLSLDDLDRLVRVCRRFYITINCYVFANLSAQLLLTGHKRKSTNTSNRNVKDFGYRKRIHLFENWRYGRYYEKQLFYHYTIYFSQILLENRWLYMTHRGQLRVHERSKQDFMVKSRPSWTLGREKESDISWITKKGEVLFGARMDGSCFVHDCENQCFNRQQLENDAITSVDFEGNLFVSSTKSHCTSFWRGNVENGDYKFELSRRLEEPFQCVKLCPKDGTILAAGKYHDREKNALKLIDVESGSTSRICSPSKAIYQLLWVDSNTILTGNFDTTMRMVDIRTARDEAIWTDPYDASVYCLDYDGAYAVLCGMKYNFRVNLYDLRIPRQCIQMYFPSSQFSQYSPVHSLAADSSQLFVVTDHDLRILNFNCHGAHTKDYTNDLNKWLY